MTHYKFAVFNREDVQVSPDFDSEESAVEYMEAHFAGQSVEVGFAHSTPFNRDDVNSL